MQKHVVKAIVTGVSILAGAAGLTAAVPPVNVFAETAATEQVIGHGEWRQEEEHWYYYQDGEMLTNCWVKDGINWYMLNEDGTRKADEMIRIDNDLYYFRSWGAMLYDNWHMDADGNLYYFRSWGGALNTGWKEIAGSWYYFDLETCAAKADTIEWIDGDLYAFDHNGEMLCDQWISDADGNLYYFRGWGAALNTGWMQLDGEWYYFDPETCAAKKDTLETIKRFFLIREYYFQGHPRQKVIFEDAMLHPPKHLVGQIQKLRGPIREVNRKFIRQLVGKMPLRPEIEPAKAARYLESVEYFFESVMRNYQGNYTSEDLHALFEAGGEMLDMILFGILRQSETGARAPSA